MNSCSYLRHSRGTASRLVAGEAVLVVPARREAHVLNETASVAWALMDGTRGTREIARELSARYSVDERDVLRDLEAFVSELAARGAVEIQGSPASAHAQQGELPAPTRYEPPAIAETQPLEVVAALCSSLRQGSGGGGKPKPPGTCRTLGACQKPFE